MLLNAVLQRKEKIMTRVNPEPGFVVVDIGTTPEAIYFFKGNAALIWGLINGVRTLKEIQAELPDEITDQYVLMRVSELLKLGLIELKD